MKLFQWMKRLKKIVRWTAIVAVTLIAAIIVICNVTPKPVIAVVRATLFTIPQDHRNHDYLAADNTVRVTVDNSYPSAFTHHQFDMYRPLQPLPKQPTLVWVHGGGFIGGDKLEEQAYATQLAKKGYSVLVMNYAWRVCKISRY